MQVSQTVGSMKSSLSLKRKFYTALLVLLVAFASMVTATFAWYIYNTSAHTTKLRMAAGSSVSLQISDEYNGTYSSSVVLDSFTGRLTPVSADQIVNDDDETLFQKVAGFTDGPANGPTLLASVFKNAAEADYYKTELFLRSSGGDCDLYLSDIGFEDSDSRLPISTAIRLGFVVHKPGSNGSVDEQFIFAINPDEHNPQAEYNTATGQEGYVLDSSKKDGTTLSFEPFTPDNYAEYDENDGTVTLKKNSEMLCQLKGGDSPVEIDVYIWLEGCDKDCTGSLSNTTLKDISLSFVGYQK